MGVLAADGASFWRRAVVALGALVWAGCVTATPSVSEAVRAQVQRWVAQEGAHVESSRGLRVEAQVGAVDARLTLAPCAAMQAYQPPGTRLWGRTRVGVRCVEGASRWNVFVPVQVAAWGPGWALKGDLPAGAVLSDQDVLAMEVDWAQAPGSVLTEQGAWAGKTLTRGLTAGTALRQDMVRNRQVFSAGAQVRVVAQGSGYAVTGSGVAVSTGFVGQAARVRMDNGRILSGAVQEDRSVRIEL